MKKISYAVALAAALSFTSCLEDQFQGLSDKPNVTSVEKLSVSPDFNWATTKVISVQVLGVPTQTPIKSTLKISANSDVFYTGFQALSDTLNLKVEVPATVNELELTMGSIQKKSVIANGKVVFSYITGINK